MPACAAASSSASSGRALGRVAEIRQQGEVQVLIAVGEEAHLEIVDELLDMRRGVDDRRHDHQRPVAGGNAAPQVELRQLARRPCVVMSRFSRLIASSLTGSAATAMTRSSSGHVAPRRAAYNTEADEDQRDAERHRAEVAESRMAEQEPHTRSPAVGG